MSFLSSCLFRIIMYLISLFYLQGKLMSFTVHVPPSHQKVNPPSTKSPNAAQQNKTVFFFVFFLFDE